MMFGRTNMDDDECLAQIEAILSEDPRARLPAEPSQLMPHVYIGSQHNAESLRLLRRLGVTHVLNCAGYKGPRAANTPSPYEGLGIEYYEFQAEDSGSYDMRQHFPEAFSFLDNCLRTGGVCLVHCALGVNRSGAVCVAYLMVHRNMSLIGAICHIKKRRSLVLCNKSFQRQLVVYARTHGINRSVSGDIMKFGGNKLQNKANSLTKTVGYSRDKSEHNLHEKFASDFLERSRRLRHDISAPHTATDLTAPKSSYQSPYKSKYNLL